MIDDGVSLFMSEPPKSECLPGIYSKLEKHGDVKIVLYLQIFCEEH